MGMTTTNVHRRTDAVRYYHLDDGCVVNAVHAGSNSYF